MEPDEAELVRRSQGGDLGAFNGIVERYQCLVFNLSARILGNRAIYGTGAPLRWVRKIVFRR